MAKLDEYQKGLLDAVIGVTGDDESRIREGIIAALKGVNAPGTRNFLWRLLDKKARAKIRRARKNAHRDLVPA